MKIEDPCPVWPLGRFENQTFTRRTPLLTEVPRGCPHLFWANTKVIY